MCSLTICIYLWILYTLTKWIGKNMSSTFTSLRSARSSLLSGGGRPRIRVLLKLYHLSCSLFYSLFHLLPPLTYRLNFFLTSFARLQRARSRSQIDQLATYSHEEDTQSSHHIPSSFTQQKGVSLLWFPLLFPLFQSMMEENH